MNERSSFLAVLIDADNVPARHAVAILDEISGLGEPSLRRVYGDWSSASLGAWKDQARELGLVMHQQSANTKGKNASDIGLVIDAMDILHAGKVGGFVLVSSDSDFTRLASRIREDGLQVIGIGEAKTPDSLRKVCNRFILIENIVSASSQQTPGTRKSGRTTEDAEPERQSPQKAIPLVLEAMKKIDPDLDHYSLGRIGQTLGQLYVDFDPRSYGCPKLSDLLRKTGRFEVFPDETGTLNVRDRA